MDVLILLDRPSQADQQRINRIAFEVEGQASFLRVVAPGVFTGALSGDAAARAPLLLQLSPGRDSVLSPENLRHNAASELEAGDQALAVAQRLLGEGFWRDVSSRAYYAAFHYARVLLWANGESPHSHKGVVHLLRKVCVEPGLLSEDLFSQFVALQRFRETADDATEVSITQAEASQAVQQAGALIARAKDLLGAKTSA